jgi:hypothetical protein
MYSFRIALRHVALFLVAACGDNVASVTPQAGIPMSLAPGGSGSVQDLPDDPPADSSPPLQRVDWRTMRGEPLHTTTTTIPAVELFALAGDGFVSRSACQAVGGCTFAWHNFAGAVRTRRSRMFPVTNGVVSPDGRRALLVALDELEQCEDPVQGVTPVARGTLQLLDLATGSTSLELALRSNVWTAPPFTPSSDWVFAAPIEDKSCFASSTGLRSASSPFAPPPGLNGTDEFVQAVDARRWVVFDEFDLGLVDPLAAKSFQFLGNDPFRFDVSRGWVHVYLGFADLAQDVVSIPPQGPERHTTLLDDDWHAFGALDRWFRVCQIQQPQGFRTCRVVDAAGEAAPADFRAAFSAAHPDDVVLLRDGGVVFVGPLDDGSLAVQRIDLLKGLREVLHPGNGTLRSLGDGTAALLVQNGVAWLIETRSEERVADHVTNVVSVPRLPLPGRVPGRQDDIAALVQSTDGVRLTLAFLDTRTRRLATLTDDLYFTPPRGPFQTTDGCGQPWTARHGGSVIEGLTQPAPQDLFFVERSKVPAVWMVPIDLSSPPRRLAELAGDPSLCHAPLASSDGRHIGFAESSQGGTTARITVTVE